jgi:hypothetical protein
MNRRLIVQFDPDEPSMSAPTFAEPDQGPLAGGRKVNARHDLTLGLWRRDCEISRGFREGDCASQISRRVGADVVSAIADRVKFRRKARWTQILYRKANGGAQEGFPRHRDQ